MIKYQALFALALAIGFTATASSAAPTTRTINLPLDEGVPIDPTTWEYDGTNGAQNNEQAANLTCQRFGYEYAISWDITANGSEAPHGTKRFTNAGDLKYCDFCRDYFAVVRCFKN